MLDVLGGSDWFWVGGGKLQTGGRGQNMMIIKKALFEGMGGRDVCNDLDPAFCSSQPCAPVPSSRSLSPRGDVRHRGSLDPLDAQSKSVARLTRKKDAGRERLEEAHQVCDTYWLSLTPTTRSNPRL